MSQLCISHDTSTLRTEVTRRTAIWINICKELISINNVIERKVSYDTHCVHLNIKYSEHYDGYFPSLQVVYYVCVYHARNK